MLCCLHSLGLLESCMRNISQIGIRKGQNLGLNHSTLTRGSSPAGGKDGSQVCQGEGWDVGGTGSHDHIKGCSPSEQAGTIVGKGFLPRLSLCRALEWMDGWMDRPRLASAPPGISPLCILCPTVVGGSGTKLWESFSKARPPLAEGSALGVIYEGCGSPATLWLLVMNFKSREYFVLAGERGGGMMAGNKSLPLVIPLTAATLFLKNPIKNYTTLCFLDFISLNKYKTNQDSKNAPFGAAPFAASDLTKQATGECEWLF